MVAASTARKKMSQQCVQVGFTEYVILAENTTCNQEKKLLSTRRKREERKVLTKRDCQSPSSYLEVMKNKFLNLKHKETALCQH